jgi:hypothetical protein
VGNADLVCPRNHHMQFLRITAWFPESKGPFCKPECEANGCGKAKVWTWDYVIPGTLQVNDYVLAAKLATGGMIGQSISHMDRFKVEDGLTADYTYNHEEWRDKPSSWLETNPTQS